PRFARRPPRRVRYARHKGEERRARSARPSREALPMVYAYATRGSARQRGSASRSFVPDAVDGAGEVVRYQPRALRQLRDVDGPAEILAVLGEPAFGERFCFLGGAVVLEAREHDARADRHRAVPRAVLGAEDAAAIAFREHAPGIERHAEVGRM